LHERAGVLAPATGLRREAPVRARVDLLGRLDLDEQYRVLGKPTELVLTTSHHRDVRVPRRDEVLEGRGLKAPGKPTLLDDGQVLTRESCRVRVRTVELHDVLGDLLDPERQRELFQSLDIRERVREEAR